MFLERFFEIIFYPLFYVLDWLLGVDEARIDRKIEENRKRLDSIDVKKLVREAMERGEDPAIYNTKDI
ncbi:hypothetical protein [Fimbriimonas ginsengisoli]|uniref:Uncharacterized protein n=1 Tax=Fimbriimonas ginsengisoli Gsoil 348 TaxID=661478 RepID=A0A068NYJ1_FIMGI|nr:hypothetical protein [Fimbriimonas ginsengisoli]AIE86999.1 hypothetical protein OP10G_3631 [Fimbriimonas ginsengisoli Gsoil 348]